MSFIEFVGKVCIIWALLRLLFQHIEMPGPKLLLLFKQARLQVFGNKARFAACESVSTLPKQDLLTRLCLLLLLFSFVPITSLKHTQTHTHTHTVKHTLASITHVRHTLCSTDLQGRDAHHRGEKQLAAGHSARRCLSTC